MIFLRIAFFSIIGLLLFAFIGSRIPQTTTDQAQVIPTGEVLTLEDFVAVGEQIYYGKGTCTLCHDIGQKGKRAPDLAGIGNRAETRKEGLSTYEYLKESLVQPAAFTVEEFEEGLMPDASAPPILLSEGEIEAVIGFLQSLGGEVTVTPVPLGEVEEKVVEVPMEEIFAGEALLNEMGCKSCHIEGGKGPILDQYGVGKDIREIENVLLQHKPAPIAGFVVEDFGVGLKAREFQSLVVYLKHGGMLGERLVNRYICLACHMIAGEGKTIGPDLTFEGDKVKPDWLLKFLLEPYKIRPREASPDSMLNLDLSEKEGEFLRGYVLSLKNKEPLPEFDPNITESEIQSGERLFNQKYGCFACHAIGEKGGIVGPSLDQVGSRLQPIWIYSWLMNPQEHIPETIMPNFGMSERNARELTAYLSSLQ
ncbi:c-type cytochrome [candidate division TA06 bacterium]|nr:c-type cytochrome [candidate division TA06 bacterium]